MLSTHHFFSNLIIIGDFNTDMLSNSSCCNHHKDILYSFSLSQVVAEPTRLRNDDSSSLIDLVLMSAPENLSECETVPPLANSDHLGISVKLTHPRAQPTYRKRRTIWRYDHADFSTACALLNQLDLEHIFAESSIDECRLHWKEAFYEIMDTCIPKGSLPSKHSLPWMTKEIVQLIKKRNYYYRKYKQNKSYGTSYKRTKNRVITKFRQSKQKFFSNQQRHSGRQLRVQIRRSYIASNPYS